MPGGLISLLLITSLFLVHFSMRNRPMPVPHPLDVDEGLPLPEAGQASTLFSLTALFGAYLGIYLILGVPALLGLASGTAGGLLLVRNWLRAQNVDTFERALERFFGGSNQNGVFLGLLLIAIQCGLATSELLILREISRVGLGLRPEQATLIALALGTIGYFYVLLGGYTALFRTDVLQFVLVAAMGLVLLALVPAATQAGAVLRFPRPGYWQVLGLRAGPLLYGYQFVVGSIMGLGFVLASPDAWKRVSLVVARGRRSPRFLVFVLAGILPFALLLPIGARTPPIPDGTASVGALLGGFLNSSALFVVAALGLVASFLSAFDGALLSTGQIGLILARRQMPTSNLDERPRFHWLMVASLITTCFLFLGLVQLSNPYAPATVLLAPYALVAGIQLGTRGKLSRLPDRSLLWIVTAGFAFWFWYLTSPAAPNLATPSTFLLNAVPIGAADCLLAAAASRLLTAGRA